MRWIFPLATALFLTGCNQDITALKAEVTQLRQEVDRQEKLLQEVKSTADFNSFLLKLQSEQDPRSVTFSLTDKGYGTVKTTQGIFLVSVEDVQPFANGVKLIMLLGNPQAMAYSGMTLSASWTKAGAPDASPQTKEVTLPQTIRSGYWNKVEMVLAPAKVDEIDKVTLRVTPNQVQLTK